MDLPSSVLAGCVVRALTGSPGLLLLESTGFVSTAFTDESPASAALLSPACAAAEELALSCALAPNDRHRPRLVPTPERRHPPGSVRADSVRADSGQMPLQSRVWSQRPGTRPRCIA